MSLSLPFRRRPADLDADAGEAVEDADAGEAVEEVKPATTTATRPRAYTPSKRELGKVTPKRKDGGRRVEPPPANRREALKRAREKRRELREKQRAQRAEIRLGMMEGKDEYLPARDKGPERSLVRDIVDSRRNIASYFLPAALIVIIGSGSSMPPEVRLGANVFWIMIALAVIVDSVLLTRRIKNAMLKRFPKAARPPRSHYFYAIMRAFQFRRLRLPKPKVNIGDAVEA